MRVGVLSLQGAFREHLSVLDSLGVSACKVTGPEQLDDIDAIILPGGESSAMVRIAATSGLFPALGDQIRAGLPAFGTCAGLILLADRLMDDSLDGFDRLGGLDVTVARNAYGRQQDSFFAPIDITGFDEEFGASFIRAPQILDVGHKVDVLAEYEGAPVLVRQDNVWGGSFHPELGPDTRIHEEFLRSCHVTV